MADIWQHYKGGVYNVLLLGRHSETDEEMVVYEDTKGEIWIRPSKMFLENVEVDGVLVPRFKKLGDFCR